MAQNAEEPSTPQVGELFEIKSGDRQALIAEKGACLLQVRVAGTNLLSVPDDDGYVGKGSHGQLLVPWPGRIFGGRYSFGGQAHQLPIDDLVSGSAIHGLVRWCPWQLAEHSASAVVLTHRMLARPGYPFNLVLEQSYSWSGAALYMRTTATNIGTRNAPYGFGQHPYFTVGTPVVDEAVLHLPASHYFAPDGPSAAAPKPLPVDGTPYDFRGGVPIGPTRLDITYTGLTRGSDGHSRVVLASPDGAVRITCAYSD
ncbi:MAG: hypothetical protein ACP5VR_06180, partial [Acidimicrobiales bacterium]